MRIVVDMQGAQSESRYRGIGRYTIAFAEAVVRNRGSHEMMLALNGLLPAGVESIRALFEDILPQENIRVWHGPAPVLAGESGNENRRAAAAILREAFLASLEPDVVHISSFFEGYVDDAVTSIPTGGSSTPVTAILYDLIPLLNPDYYLQPHPLYERFYLDKVSALKRADSLLAISESTRQEGLQHLHIEPERITNIAAAVDARFAPCSQSDEQRNALQCKFGISRPFVLYTGGADERKNLARLIMGFAALPPEVRSRHQLVLAGRFVSAELPVLHKVIKESGLGADEILLTGYVSDKEIISLYNLCTLFVFPSWHEGFGLPALEAMSCGAPVIGGDAGSLPEVIGLEEALFDPFEVSAITAHLAKALDDDGFRHRLREHGLRQGRNFSWDKTAQLAISVWEALHDRRSAPSRTHHNLFTVSELAESLSRPASRLKAPELVGLAACIAENKQSGVTRQILLDVSRAFGSELEASSPSEERVLYNALLNCPPKGFLVVPVYAKSNGSYHYADACNRDSRRSREQAQTGRPIEWQRGDIFCGFYVPPHVQLPNAAFYARLKAEGVTVKFLLGESLSLADENPANSNRDEEISQSWLAMLAGSDGVIFSSKIDVEAFTKVTAPKTLLPQASPQEQADKLKWALVSANYPRRQLLVDISELVQQDVKSGIQRVVRSILKELLLRPPDGYRVEPVYATAGKGYKYARNFTQSFCAGTDNIVSDDFIDYAPGDFFLGLDLQTGVVAAQSEIYQHLRRQGVTVQFVVYDLLCVLQPQHFPPGAEEVFTQWLKVVGECDGAICITETVANELAEWLSSHPPKERCRSFALNWFHLGADVENSVPTSGMPPEAGDVLDRLRSRPSFLMVGTLEPRKGHAQVLAAFEELWANGQEFNLVIVGKPGWMVEQLCSRIRGHEQYHKRLFWLEGISDEYLEEIYAASTCLMAASYGEGFGLPLIEAARHGVPILARDIPVFREVAGEHAAYFQALDSSQLARSLTDWLSAYHRNVHPKPAGIKYCTWSQSASMLLAKTINQTDSTHA
jgi:glycosyltransferase involved in cell wall biosynthesis